MSEREQVASLLDGLADDLKQLKAAVLVLLDERDNWLLKSVAVQQRRDDVRTQVATATQALAVLKSEGQSRAANVEKLRSQTLSAWEFTIANAERCIDGGETEARSVLDDFRDACKELKELEADIQPQEMEVQRVTQELGRAQAACDAYKVLNCCARSCVATWTQHLRERRMVLRSFDADTRRKMDVLHSQLNQAESHVKAVASPDLAPRPLRPAALEEALAAAAAATAPQPQLASNGAVPHAAAAGERAAQRSPPPAPVSDANASPHRPAEREQDNATGAPREGEASEVLASDRADAARDSGRPHARHQQPTALSYSTTQLSSPRSSASSPGPTSQLTFAACSAKSAAPNSAVAQDACRSTPADAPQPVADPLRTAADKLPTRAPSGGLVPGSSKELQTPVGLGRSVGSIAEHYGGASPAAGATQRPGDLSASVPPLAAGCAVGSKPGGLCPPAADVLIELPQSGDQGRAPPAAGQEGAPAAASTREAARPNDCGTRPTEAAAHVIDRLSTVGDAAPSAAGPHSAAPSRGALGAQLPHAAQGAGSAVDGVGQAGAQPPLPEAAEPAAARGRCSDPVATPTAHRPPLPPQAPQPPPPPNPPLPPLPPQSALPSRLPPSPPPPLPPGSPPRTAGTPAPPLPPPSLDAAAESRPVTPALPNRPLERSLRDAVAAHHDALMPAIETQLSSMAPSSAHPSAYGPSVLAGAASAAPGGSVVPASPANLEEWLYRGTRTPAPAAADARLRYKVKTEEEARQPAASPAAHPSALVANVKLSASPVAPPAAARAPPPATTARPAAAPSPSRVVPKQQAPAAASRAAPAAAPRVAPAPRAASAAAQTAAPTGGRPEQRAGQPARASNVQAATNDVHSAQRGAADSSSDAIEPGELVSVGSKDGPPAPVEARQNQPGKMNGAKGSQQANAHGAKSNPNKGGGKAGGKVASGGANNKTPDGKGQRGKKGKPYPCSYHAAGHCRLGGNCAFAHGPRPHKKNGARPDGGNQAAAVNGQAAGGSTSAASQPAGNLQRGAERAPRSRKRNRIEFVPPPNVAAESPAAQPGPPADGDDARSSKRPAPSQPPGAGAGSTDVYRGLRVRTSSFPGLHGPPPGEPPPMNPLHPGMMEALFQQPPSFARDQAMMNSWNPGANPWGMCPGGRPPMMQPMGGHMLHMHVDGPVPSTQPGVWGHVSPNGGQPNGANPAANGWGNGPTRRANY